MDEYSLELERTSESLNQVVSKIVVGSTKTILQELMSDQMQNTADSSPFFEELETLRMDVSANRMCSQMLKRMTNDVTITLRDMEQKSEGLGREVRRLSHALGSRDAKIEVSTQL